MTSRPSGSLSVTIASVRIVLDHEGGIDQLAVDAPGERRLAQSRPNAARDLVHRYRVIEAALAAIGQCDNGHTEPSVRTLSAEHEPGRQKRALRLAASALFLHLVGASGIEPPTTTMSR